MTTLLKIRPEDLKKLNLNEGSVLLLTVPTDTDFKVMNEAAQILEEAGRRVIGFKPQVVVMPDVYEVEKLYLPDLVILRARIDGLISYHTKKINIIKESGEA